MSNSDAAAPTDAAENLQVLIDSMRLAAQVLGGAGAASFTPAMTANVINGWAEELQRDTYKLVTGREPSAGTKPRRRVEVKIAIVGHKHGDNVYLGLSDSALFDHLHAFCEEYWSEARSFDPSLPEDIYELGPKEAVDAYFQAHPSESLAYTSDSICMPFPQGFVLGQPSDQESEPLQWWSNENGWGDLSIATVFDEECEHLPIGSVGAGLTKARWYSLPA